MKRTRNIVFAVVGAVLAAAGGALAAWVIYSGAGGAGAGKVGSSTINNAVVLTANSTGVTSVIPGTDGTVMAGVNNAATVPETVTALTVSSITASPTCDTSGLTFTAYSGFIGKSLTVGNNGGLEIGTLHAASTLDPACANATITVNLTGTTNP